MRFFFSFLVYALSGGLVVADETAATRDPLAGAPEPLAAAIRNYGKDADRWAYTQHSFEYDGKGRLNEEKLVRFDPSKHYDEQWTLLLTGGKEPTEAQQKKYRRKKADREKKEKRTLGELLNLRKAVVVDESAAALTYEVPLSLENNTRLPPKKFQVFVRLDKASQSLRLVEVKLRESMRFALVVKVKKGGARIEFSQVQPEFSAVVSGVSVEGQGSVMFVPVGGRAEMMRTDYKRVTPYDERFNVKIGPLKALDF